MRRREGQGCYKSKVRLDCSDAWTVTIAQMPFGARPIGFFYVGNKCEDYTKELPTGTYVNNRCSFDNSEQRCVGYLCSIDNLNKNDINSTICDNKINNKKVTYREIKKIEIDRINRSKKVVQNIVKKFNKKYRRNTQYKVKSYILNNSNNAFPQYNSLNLTFNDKLTSDYILQEF